MKSRVAAQSDANLSRLSSLPSEQSSNAHGRPHGGARWLDERACRHGIGSYESDNVPAFKTRFIASFAGQIAWW